MAAPANIDPTSIGGTPGDIGCSVSGMDASSNLEPPSSVVTSFE
jgi:hypothetical protein